MINRLINYAIVFSTILLYFNSRVNADIFKAVFILFFVMIMFKKFKQELTINKNIIFFIFFIFFNIAAYPYVFMKNFLTVGYFLIIFILYYYYILKNDIFSLVNTYINFAFLMAFIGIIQELLFFLNPDWLFYLSAGKNPDFIYGQSFDILRIASLLDEPSKLGLFIMPALFFGIGKYFLNYKMVLLSKTKFIIIILAFILTFSAHAFLSGIIAFFIIIISQKSIKKYFILIIFCILLPFILSQDVVTEKLINSGIFTGGINTSSSTIATSALFYVSFLSVLDIFNNFIFFGVGMNNFNEIAQVYWNQIGMNINCDDGSTIGYARIIVEFGIFGFLLLVFFLRKILIKSTTDYIDEKTKYLYFINKISFLFIILDLFRMGFYINPPIIFFIALCAVSKIKYMQYLYHRI